MPVFFELKFEVVPGILPRGMTTAISIEMNVHEGPSGSNRSRLVMIILGAFWSMGCFTGLFTWFLTPWTVFRSMDFKNSVF